ncbi:ABC transporter permease/M1 family aminopeptidase [Pontibacter sp. H249]|uniref:ABC transporter permease/M1 family aminopeptidase n=1 Tax=Pontibacter sp. H249 TaxID=3133420 RepID=UPI0030C55161
MKFREIFRFELVYQLSRIYTWLYFGIFLTLTFTMAASFVDNVRDGDYLLNAPIVTAAISSIASLLGLLVVAAVAGDAATHDLQERIEPLLYTSSVSKVAYLGGRFLGAFVIIAGVMLVVPLGLILITVLPGIDATLFGAPQPLGYLNAYLLVALPNTFVFTAILFTVALLSRHAFTSFLVGGFLFMGSLTIKEILADQMGMWDLGRLLDMSGFTVFGELKMATPPHEINTKQIGLEAGLYWNRALWLAVALGVLGLSYYRFRFAYFVSNSWWSRLLIKKAISIETGLPAPVAVPQLKGNFNFNTHVLQAVSIAQHSFRESITSWVWIALAGLVAMLLIVVPELLQGPLGVPRTPATNRMVSLFSFLPVQLMVVALITIYVGQLVWRERDARMNDIADAAPVPSTVLLAGKLLSILLLLLTLQAVFITTGMLIQLAEGHKALEPGLYFKAVFGLQMVDYLLIACVAMAVHVLVNQKYMGHMIVFLTFLYTLFAGELGVRDKLLIYGAAPAYSYSNISGFAATLAPWFWFKLYWAGWALMLALVAKMLWVRGREIYLKRRFYQAFAKPTRTLILTGAAGAVLIFTTGAFVFYNTSILNKNFSLDELAERRARYEQFYSKYSHEVQPGVTAIALHVELYPEQQKAEVQGAYTLRNNSNTTINTVHLATAAEAETTRLYFSRKSSIILQDDDLRHRVYTLQEPLLPGDSVKLYFKLTYNPQGFTNEGNSTSVVENGTFFVAQDWLPAVGYQAERELSNAAARSKYKLPVKPATPSLYDSTALYKMANRERVRFETTVGTVQDQLAVAPGLLLKSWVKGGRRYFHYKADNPIRTMFPIFSSNYAVREAKWQDVQLQIFHHPAHTLNLDRMEQSIKASLGYYTKQFGPYPHKQLKLVEYAGAGTGATSYPGTIAYTESFAALNPAADYREFDLPFAVVAHEIAHQWWAHQLIPAPVEGAPVLAESLSWYSALGVVEQKYGPDHLWRLLHVMRDSYLTPRSKADLPLIRATDPFQAYRKGPFAMYTLRQYIGEEQVNQVLRRLLQKYKSGQPPLPTTLDLYRELRAVTPDSSKNLLADLFERNTFWDVEMKEAQAMQQSNGKWQVKLEVKARKVQVDSTGIETEMPMNEPVEIGIFAAQKQENSKPLYLRKHYIRSGVQQLTVIVPDKPTAASIDPNHLLIDTNIYDNRKEIKTKEVPKLFGVIQFKPKDLVIDFVTTSFL